MNERPTLLDLFSGIGGFSLAFEAEGFGTIGFSEIDPYASAVLKKHWPDVPNYGDIRNVRGVRADVVTGGFPCQPFSVAGKRRGAADDRHLWPEMLRVISEARPAWVLGENVPGIIGMELDNCISDLEALGYAVQPLVVPAVAVDARHRRDRVWIVANHDSGGQSRARMDAAEERNTVADSCGAGEITTHPPSEQSGRREQFEVSPNIGTGGEGVGPDSNKSGPQRRDGRGMQECESERTAGESGSPPPDAALNMRHRAWTPKQARRNESTNGCQWLPEPAVGRVANGIPNRVDRLRCLGNSIVPQVAQVFARAIYEQITCAGPSTN